MSRVVVKQATQREIVDMKRNSSNVVISGGKDSEITYVFALLGGKKVKKNITIKLKQGASAKIIGIIMAEDSQMHDITTTMHHTEPNSKGDIKVKIIGKDESKVHYDGMIKIDKKAQLTNSYLDASAMMLNKGAECNGKPELEIEADDVKASHSFSMGKIDPEHLFYLQSRGLTERDAEKMIIEGFLFEVLQGVSKEVQEKIKKEVRKKLT